MFQYPHYKYCLRGKSTHFGMKLFIPKYVSILIIHIALKKNWVYQLILVWDY